MNNGEDLKNTLETSVQHAGDRERFKRTKTIKRKGFDGVSWLDHATAHRASKPLELVIEAKLLLATDEEEEIFKPVVCYKEPLDGLPPKERREFDNKPIIYDVEEFCRLLGGEISDLITQAGRHGSIKIILTTDGPRMDDSRFLEELEPWYNTPEGKKQVDIFLSKQKLEQFKPDD